MFKRTGLESLRAMIVPVICCAFALSVAIYGLDQAERGSRIEGLRALEESLKRAVVTSYSVEGRYPASLSHIEKNYGVHIDRTKYLVFYEIVASNVMPTIVVLELETTSN